LDYHLIQQVLSSVTADLFLTIVIHHTNEFFFPSSLIATS